MSNSIFLVAHRGASKDAPENTLPAFQLGWEQGADAIEGDFHLTKDGQIVCIHDFDTEKVAGVRQVVADSTLKDLQSLDVGNWFDEKFQGTRPPTLKEVFETVPSGKKFFLEVKCGPEIVPELMIQIESSGLPLEQIVVISFNKEVIKAVEEAKSSLKTCWLTQFKLDEETGEILPTKESVLSDLKSLGTNGVSTYHEHLTEAWIKQVHDAGFEHHVWTVDDADLAAKLIRWGIDSVTTNVPGQIRSHLDSSQER